jgi:hypothetical protein
MREPQTAEANAGDEPDAMETQTMFPPFIISRAFRRLLNCFEQNYFLIFPNIPCAYCGLNSSYRTTHWLPVQQAATEEHRFELRSRLHLGLHVDRRGRVAICRECHREPRGAINAGPWPSLLLNIPQRSRMYLSPLKLNCNLGRTQSHSGTQYHNPWSTYRTLSGIALCTELDSLFREYVSQLQRSSALLVWWNHRSISVL